MIVNVLFRYLICLLLFAVSLPVNAQENDQAMVEWRLEYPGKIKAGDSVLVTVILNIASGYHIYAPTEMNMMQDLQIMTVSFTPSVTGIKRSGELLLPDYVQKGVFQVYKGNDVRFLQRFAIGKEMKPGDYVLKVELVTQACNEQICFSPVTETKDVMIKVIPR